MKLAGQSNLTKSFDAQKWLKRLFWFALLLMHLVAFPAALNAVDSSGDIASAAVSGLRFVGLVLSIAAFVLKIIDVRWLRIAPGWRSIVLTILVIGLLHVGVVERASHGDAMVNPAHLGLVLVAGSAWQLAAAKRRLSRLLPQIRAPHRRGPLPLVLYRLTHADVTSIVQAFVSRIFVPRAPPAAI